MNVYKTVVNWKSKLKLLACSRIAGATLGEQHSLQCCFLLREERWGLSALAPSFQENAHQRQWRRSQPALMLTRLEQRELAFENDQMISVDYLGRKAKTV